MRTTTWVAAEFAVRSIYRGMTTNGGFAASVCAPPFCYGQTVSASGNIGQQNINANYASVNAQSGLYAGDGGYEVDVANHTQLDGVLRLALFKVKRRSLSRAFLESQRLCLEKSGLPDEIEQMRASAVSSRL